MTHEDQQKIKASMRDRMRKAHIPEKSIDNKIAEFFSGDPKLKKYTQEEYSDDNELNEFILAVKKRAAQFSKAARLNAVKLSKKTKNKVSAARADFKNSKQDKSGMATTAQTFIRIIKANRKAGAGTAVILVLVCLVGFAFFSSKSSNSTDVQGASTNSAEVVKPDFEVVVPSGQEESSVAYDQEKQVASRTGKIGSVNVVISQQKVSAADITRENFLLTVAQSFGINKETQTTKGSVFLGSNEKERVTTAVFQTGTFLVFLRADDIVPDASVIEFINSLQI